MISISMMTVEDFEAYPLPMLMGIVAGRLARDSTEVDALVAALRSPEALRFSLPAVVRLHAQLGAVLNRVDE
jgi:hypothetical protein